MELEIKACNKWLWEQFYKYPNGGWEEGTAFQVSFSIKKKKPESPGV